MSPLSLYSIAYSFQSYDDKIWPFSSLFQLKKKTPPTESEKEEAEKLKIEGNDLMRTEQYEGAIEKYSR